MSRAVAARAADAVVHGRAAGGARSCSASTCSGSSGASARAASTASSRRDRDARQHRPRRAQRAGRARHGGERGDDDRRPRRGGRSRSSIRTGVCSARAGADSISRLGCRAATRPSVRTMRTAGGAWRVHARPRRVRRSHPRAAGRQPAGRVLREQREVHEAMLVGIPIVLLLAAGGGLWLASIGLRPITDMARRAASIPPNGLEDLGETTGPTSSVNWRRRSTAWSRGCARRCRRSGSSWPTRRTSCGRRCRSFAPRPTSC